MTSLPLSCARLFSMAKARRPMAATISVFELRRLLGLSSPRIFGFGPGEPAVDYEL